MDKINTLASLVNSIKKQTRLLATKTPASNPPPQEVIEKNHPASQQAPAPPVPTDDGDVTILAEGHFEYQPPFINPNE